MNVHEGGIGNAGDAAYAEPACVGREVEIISAVAKNFNSQESSDLEAVLPESLKAELEPFINGELTKSLSSGVTAKFSNKIQGGFRIGPKDGSYFIDLTAESFDALISEYLRPVTRKMLFGE